MSPGFVQATSERHRALWGALASVVLIALVLGVPVWLVSAGGSPFTHLGGDGPGRSVVTGHGNDIPVVSHWLVGVALLMAWLFWGWMTTCVVLEIRSWVLGRSRTRLPASRTLQSVVACMVGTALALSFVGRQAHEAFDLSSRAPDVSGASPSALRVVGDRHPIGTLYRVTPDGLVSASDLVTPDESGSLDDPLSRDEPVVIEPLPVPAIDAGERSAVSLTPDTARDVPMVARLTDLPMRPHADIARDGLDTLVAVHVVEHRETLWSIAEQRLGSARRWREIAELNYGVRQGDGSHMTGDHWVKPGWILTLPVPGGRPSGSERIAGSRLLRQEPPFPPFGAGIVGVGLADLVDRFRRVQQRHRPTGGSMKLPDPELRDVEGRLRSGDGREVLRSVDAAVRLYLRSSPGGAGRVPRITGIVISGREVRLVLDPGELPTHLPDEFTLEPEAPAVRIDRTIADAIGSLPDGERTRAFPLPTLVSIGRNQDETAFAHLEGMGSVVVRGDPEVRDGVARLLALELATSRWSHGFDLLLVGFGAEFSRFARVSSVNDPGSVAEELARRQLSGSILLERHREASFLEARARDRSGSWDPLVVLCGPTVPAEGAAELLFRSGDGRGGTAVLAFCEGVEALHDLRVDTGGDDPSLEVLGTIVTPQRATAHELTDVVALLDASERLDACAAVVFRPTEDDAGVRASRNVEATPAYASTPVGGSNVVVTVADGALAELHNGKVTALPQLGAASPEVEIAVLGPVEIRGAAREFTRAWAKELVVYLAMHPQGASNDTWATALWPDRVMAPSSLHSTASVARRSLGTSRDGFDHLPRSHGRLALAPTVATDWDRFVVQAESEDPACWRSALEIVRGRPFEGLRSSDWSILDGIAPAIESRVVDLSGRLAGSYLRAGDARGAEWAARRGLLVSPYDERLYRMLMRAADLAGNSHGVESVMAELVRVVADEIEPIESVHPSTWELYRSLSRRPSIHP